MKWVHCRLVGPVVIVGSIHSIGLAQMSYVSQFRMVTANGQSIASPVGNNGTFNETADQTIDLSPPDGWLVGAISSQNSTLGATQINFAGSNHVTGSWDLGDDQLTGAVANFRFNVFFDLAVASPISLIGSNTTTHSDEFNLHGQSTQHIWLIHVDQPEILFNRTFDPLDPGATLGNFSYFAELPAGRYRLNIEAYNTSHGFIDLGSMNPNSASINLSLTVPSPGAALMGLPIAVMALRRRRA